MRSIRLTLASLCLALASAPHSWAEGVQLSDPEAKRLLNMHGCNSCHEADAVRIGPAFRDVAAMYPNASPETVERLVMKVRRGGAGIWGQTPMVSTPRLPDQDAERIVRWILALKRNDP